MLELTTKIVQKEDLIAANLGNEVMMMSLETDNYFALDSVGSEIWQLMQHPVTIAEICAALQERYAVSADTCLADTQAFLQRMIDEKVAHVVES